MSLPDMPAARVEAAINSICSSTSARQQRSVVLDLLDGVRGVSIHEAGKIMTRADSKQQRSNVPAKYMEVESKPAITDGAEIGLDGLAGLCARLLHLRTLWAARGAVRWRGSLGRACLCALKRSSLEIRRERTSTTEESEVILSFETNHQQPRFVIDILESRLAPFLHGLQTKAAVLRLGIVAADNLKESVSISLSMLM